VTATFMRAMCLSSFIIDWRKELNFCTVGRNLQNWLIVCFPDKFFLIQLNITSFQLMKTAARATFLILIYANLQFAGLH
jgi:hypothetical protein